MTKNCFSITSTALAIALSLLGIAMLSGCSGSGENSSVVITGRVTAGNTESATIRVFDANGNPLTILASDAAATAQAGVSAKSTARVSLQWVNGTGTFAIRVSPFVTDFRVEATGGTSGGYPFEGTQVAEVRGYEPGTTIVYIHPGTTLVAACLRKHPDWSLPQAETAVRRFLQVPDSLDIAAGLRSSSNPYFDHITFLGQAEANGGLDRFVTGLVDEMDGNGNATRPFVTSTSGDVGLLKGGVADVLAWSGQQFASGALSYLGSNAMSYVLGKFGLDMGGDPLNEVKQQLSQISAQLTVLQSQVKNMAADLSCEIGFYGYQGSIEGLGYKTLEDIEHIADLYDTLLHFDPADKSDEKRQEIERQKEQIRKETLALGTDLHSLIHRLIVGDDSLSTQGAIKGLSRMLKTCGRFINGDKSAAIQRQYAFLALHQVQSCQIVVNYYTDAGLYAQADKEAKKCTQYIKDVQALSIPNTLPPAATSCWHHGPMRQCGVGDQLVDTSTNLLWWVGPSIYADADNMYAEMGWGMGASLEDRRWKTPTCSDMTTFLQGVGGDPQPLTYLQKQGFRAGFYLDGHPFAFATNDIPVRQPPFLIMDGRDYGICYGSDGCSDILWGSGWADQVDPATGMNPSINGYSAMSRHAVYSDGACSPASNTQTKVLLVRPPAAGEIYSW